MDFKWPISNAEYKAALVNLPSYRHPVLLFVEGEWKVFARRWETETDKGTGCCRSAQAKPRAAPPTGWRNHHSEWVQTTHAYYPSGYSLRSNTAGCSTTLIRLLGTTVTVEREIINEYVRKWKEVVLTKIKAQICIKIIQVQNTLT
jgi:hypothetical protein